MNRVALMLLVVMAGCKTVVTTTTEIVPSRYALLEFTRQIPRDSAVAIAARALIAESIKVQGISAKEGMVKGGPVKFAVQDQQPALDALVTISAMAAGPETTVRILASSPVAISVTGGIDSRLVELAQRIVHRMEAMIAR